MVKDASSYIHHEISCFRDTELQFLKMIPTGVIYRVCRAKPVIARQDGFRLYRAADFHETRDVMLAAYERLSPLGATRQAKLEEQWCAEQEAKVE